MSTPPSARTAQVRGRPGPRRPVAGAATVVPEPTPPTLQRSLLRAMRPRQWAKNLLVFAAPGAAGVLLEGRVIWRTLLAAGAFCLSSSALYLVNDVVDRDADRRHPTKRDRPIAAGHLPVKTALTAAAILLAGAVLVAALTARPWLLAALAAHAVLTTSYSWKLKHVAVVDLVAVSLGFVVRALAGGAAAAVPLSNWFLICTSFGSLFVVAGKRLAELEHLARNGRDAASIRPTLGMYRPPFLRLVIGTSMAVTMLAYCLWAFERAELRPASIPWYELSIIPMVSALLRYALLLDGGHGSAPEDVFLSDVALGVLAVVWLVVFALGVARV